jgi:hypothetical protein
VDRTAISRTVLAALCDNSAVRAIVVVIALAAAAAVPAVSRTAPAEPALRIELEQPLTVTGRAFAARELVTVRALGTFGTRTLRVRTTRRGAFRVSFRAVSGSPCVLRRLVAVGLRGSRATLRLPPGACVDG